MSSSYDRNIERMRSRERTNVQTANAQRTNMANIMGQRGIDEAQDVSKQCRWELAEVIISVIFEFFAHYFQFLVLNASIVYYS